ncbi:Telomere-associated protein RIF1 [Cyphomyrmex costatus]|uniref:Telomere-associated protein RIF1 n=1 Tax=Cyphomyrmex costatus TaxID=456900 RepID=A0A195CUD0_9HYME|nr:Telomere-associated protein RIF1 [Cyphomyrmex costatus]
MYVVKNIVLNLAIKILHLLYSHARKLETSGIIKEEWYKDLLRLIIESFLKSDGTDQPEALTAFNTIMYEFRAHSLNLFESMLQTNLKIRLMIFAQLKGLDDNVISAAVNDGQALNFFKSCFINVQPTLMEWLTPTACVDNLQMLIKIEKQIEDSNEPKPEEEVNYGALALLRRLYRMASITFDQSIQKFDTLLMDKVVTLAYMGHKHQRGPALKLLQQALTTNSSAHIRKEYPDVWAQYKTNLQSAYYKRMLLLVMACELDWTIQWNTTIQFLGTDLHRGASLINNLLSVEEKAFKSTDPVIRRQAFLSWRLLIDNFALDHQELATTRRIKLLCIPLNAKNSKTELIALTKLEVWWHLIVKLYRDIGKFANPVITQFLNYCFGPLGDTPLLSSKFDVVASPGKRFFKTKAIAVDALGQLLVAKEDLATVCSPMLEERLPHAISYDVFRECSKSIIHSIAEVLLILAQITDKEMKYRFQLGKTLWTSLMIYIGTVKLTTKDHLYRDVIIVVTELGNHIDKLMVKDIIFDVILPSLNCIIEKTEFHDNALPELVLKFLSPPILDEVVSCILFKNYDSNTIKCLLERCVSSEFSYSSGVLGFLETIMENLKSINIVSNKKGLKETICLELWSIIAEILTKYIRSTEINGEDTFKIMKSVLSFPICLEDISQVQINKPVMVWKTMYKEVELHSDLITTMKPNEILLDTANMMRNCLSKNMKCCIFVVNCLDILLSTVNYEFLLTQDEIPSILQLIIDIITVSVDVHLRNTIIALKALTALLSTVYGHNVQRIVSYLYSCKSVMELILSSKIVLLVNEVVVTWESVVSIFKGLKKLDHEFLLSYKNAIGIALNHTNFKIKHATLSIFEIRDHLDSAAKCVLDEIKTLNEKRYRLILPKTDTKQKTQTGKTKEMHIAGSFLNRKSVITKSVSNKSPEKSDKNTPVVPEPDSQDYVYIQTDLKFDVNRLTEHQKESLKRKRDDIPALYNDLSQSSSQNSQNLQQWFDIKAKEINEIDKVNNKKTDSTMQKPNDNDANKENKVTTKEVELPNTTDERVDNICSNELDGNIKKNTVDENTEQNENVTKKLKTDESNEKQNTLKQTNLSSHIASTNEKNTTSKVDEDGDATMAIVSVTKKLNSESRNEFPEDDKMHEQSSLTSDNTKRQNRNSTTKSTSLKNDETTETQKDASITNIQRTRVKTTQGKLDTNRKQKSDDNIDIKENVNENKKGIKRKFVADTESDTGNVQRRKRKLIISKNDYDGESSRSNDIFPNIKMDNVSQRVKNEISRLKIDMVFDCHAINRRRVKHSNEGKTLGLRKYSTPDNKNFKLKSVDAKSADGSKRSPKTPEKNTKNIDDQVVKRRGRRSKQELNKNDLAINKNINIEVNKDINKDVNKDKDVNKSNDIVNKVPELKNTDTGVSCYVSTSSQINISETKKHDISENEKRKNNLKCNSDVSHAKLIESSEQSQDEIEDVIESSQAPDISVKLDKIYGEKQCFIRIDKMTNVHAAKISDTIVDKNYVPESVPMDCGDNDISDAGEKLEEANPDSKRETKNKENINSIDEDLIEKTDNSNTKSLILEDQKTIDNSSSIKSTSIITFSSPRSNSKIFSKPKPFTGRAAHMLGLVTNQVRLESDNPTVLEDESSIKKLKMKDTENETSTNKKISVIKEIDKIGGPSGSRQEKIFSNMRSTDYSASLSTHTFTTLKNDGEKLSFKLNAPDCLSTENLGDKENERNVSLLREKEDLPILEWSSANPPSLTASPSASILKRNRSSLPDSKSGQESDSDISTFKLQRKRVSFADPPVSKEMGYEITTVQKTIKYSMTRSPTSKKDSPIKFKQTKHKLVPLDIEKINEDDMQDENSTESVEVEKQDESLTKISEMYSEAMDGGTEDTETQQDIFDVIGAKIDVMINDQTNNDQTSNDINTIIQNKSVDSIKLNVTNDSVIEALPIKGDNPINMEDTVDVQNITELNSTVNADEIFCEKPIRSSTQAIENVAEQDTLSVTDSIFESLSSTQNVQNQESPNNVELDPEFLDSTHSIYPTLSSCMEPIDTIIERLTYPLWKNNLITYFSNRNMHTIGDFARLSEREVDRIPVKGKPKTEFVKKVLEKFESMYKLQIEPSNNKSNEVEQLPNKAMDKEPTVLIAAVSDGETGSAIINNDSLICSTLLQPTEDILDNLSREDSTEDSDKTESITSDMDISLESVVPDNPDLSVLDTFKKDEQTNAKIPINAEISKLETFIGNTESVLIPSSSTESIGITSQVASSSNVSLDTPKDSTVSSSAVNELLITHSSIGTSTDEVGSTTSTIQKSTKSVASQMTLAELLDEIDLNQVMKSAVRRCSPEAILLQYKVKMAHLKEGELLKETLKILGLQNKQQVNEASLKAACRACGVNKVLLKLPDIFSHDEQFFDKVLKVYNKKLNLAEGLNNLDFDQLKSAIYQKCKSFQIIEILLEKLKQEEQEGIKRSMPESSLNAMLQSLPMDVIISHTVANEELIPASVVLDIALQNNSSENIAKALKQSPVMTKHVLDELWTSQFTISHIENDDLPKESLLNIFKSICSKLTAQELLNTYHEAMANKLTELKNTKDLRDEKE